VQVQPYEVPGWGIGELWLQDGTLVYHELPRAAPPSAARTRQASALLELVEAYFAGRPVAFDEVELELEWCTPFQRAVAEALRRVPYGETVTYGELAIAAGYPNAHRAAGTFCAANRFPLILPCHRVVSTAGIGSYGSLGSDYKRRLLALEGVSIGAL
jgi:methylated-DNA-[protein]-cysteine S-methyltransferase